LQIVDQRVAGIDVGKKLVAVAVRTPGEEPGQRQQQQLRKFKTFYPVLREMVGWLVAQGVTHVAMEATGVYWRPVVRHEVPRVRAEVKGLRLRPVAAGR
jgi:transposase